MTRLALLVLFALPAGIPAGFAFSTGAPPCHNVLSLTPSGKILLAQSKKIQQGRDAAAVKQWSSDFLLEATRDLIQLPPSCHSHWEGLRRLTYKLYLSRLGVQGKKIPWFKALATDDHGALKQRLKAPVSLSQVYRHQTQIKGVWVFSQKPVDTEAWNQTLDLVCPTFPCPFWHPDFIFRTLVIEPKDVAAYTPETATLALSRSLFESQPPALPAVHELVHVAARYAKWRLGEDWKAQFDRFSGWHVPHASQWVHKGKPLDGVRVGQQTFEGFCYTRSRTHSIGVRDSEEDLADHGAAYFVDPQCFCEKGKMKLPQKWTWLRAHFPPRPRPCP